MAIAKRQITRIQDADDIAAAQTFSGGLVAPTINGGTAANDDLTLQGTADGTRTTSHVLLQPNGGHIQLGTEATVLYRGANQFLHTYADAASIGAGHGYNLFIGNAGNFTLAPDGVSFEHASYNLGIGKGALEAVTWGFENIGIGYSSLKVLTTGSEDVAVGEGAGYRVTSGSGNVMIGDGALGYLSDGAYCVGVGLDCGFNPANEIAQYRVISDVELTLIGKAATKNSASVLTNSIAIGARAQVTKSYQVVLGNDEIGETLLRGAVGIGMAPGTGVSLDIVGSARLPKDSSLFFGVTGSQASITNTAANVLSFVNTGGGYVFKNSTLSADLLAIAEGGAITVTGGIRPAADGTTALTLTNVAGTAIVAVDTINKITYMSGAVSTAPLGAELVVNGTFASNDFTGWTAGANWVAATGAAVHTAGSIETITQDVSVSTGTKYQIVFTTAGRNAGSITVSLGAVTLDIGGGVTAITGNTTYTSSITAGATGSLAFTVTPTNDWDGSIDSISLKAIGAAQSALSLKDDAGNVFAEFRGKQSLGNTATGYAALLSNTTGSQNSVGAGYAALYSNSTGSQNSVGAGAYALHSNSTGSQNSVGAGAYALHSNTTGSNNTASGYNSGRYHANGSTPLTDPENSIYIGAESRGKDNDDNNSIVIGYTAIGLGANTTVIGNTSTVLTALPGGALRLSEMAAPTGTSNNATLYTRDSGGGKTVLCCKLGDDVEIVLATQA